MIENIPQKSVFMVNPMSWRTFISNAHCKIKLMVFDLRSSVWMGFVMNIFKTYPILHITVSRWIRPSLTWRLNEKPKHVWYKKRITDLISQSASDLILKSFWDHTIKLKGYSYRDATNLQLLTSPTGRRRESSWRRQIEIQG